MHSRFRLLALLACIFAYSGRAKAEDYPVQGTWIVTKIVSGALTKSYHDNVVKRFCKQGTGDRIVFRKNRSWLVSNGRRFDYVKLRGLELVKANTYRLTEPSRSLIWHPTVELKETGEIEFTTDAGSVWTLKKCPGNRR